ncbi:MAG: hypothetical protein NVS2B5_05780 [Beijerinckiaceae bacterium]
MPENTAGKQRGKPFKQGQSGNPAGKPVGARHKATLAAEALLDGEAETITRKAIEMAKGGDMTAMRLCLERIVSPRRDRPVSFILPKLDAPADVVAGAAAIAQAVSEGEITPAEAADLSKVVASVGHAIELTEIEGRLRKLEERVEGKAG